MENTVQPLALIVGGSSGMGLATARLLVKRGIKTVVVGNKSEKLDVAKRELAALGNVETIQANLHEPDGVQRIVAFAESQGCHIKYLVNAAGYFKPTPFLEHGHSDYDAYLNLNRAIFLKTRRTSSRKTCPAQVSRVLRVVRSNSRTPRSSSSSLIARDNGDCSMCSRSAALAKCSSSATAMKQRRCRNSMAPFVLCHHSMVPDHGVSRMRVHARYARRVLEAELKLPITSAIRS